MYAGSYRLAPAGSRPTRARISSACSWPASDSSDLVVLLVDPEVARRLGLVGLLLLLLPGEQRRHLVHALVDLGAVLGLARDDERRARLVDQDRVHLVDDGVGEAALEALLDVHRHVVAQVVEAELVVGAVGDVGGVRRALRPRGSIVRQVDADREAEEAGRSCPSTRRRAARGSRSP